MKRILVCSLLLAGSSSFAQDSAQPVKPTFTISGYLEAYYSYDLNKPADNTKAGFLYSHNRHNEVNLNLGFVKAAYSSDNVRANLALAAGTYMNANYAAEPGVLKNVYEANAGVKISKTKNLWLDAGFFSSHIGFESAVSKDYPTLTRSIMAENTPYYESGAKLTYTSNNTKWLLSAMVLNGWQRIQRVDGNSYMSFGTQVQFKPSAATTLNYSTFIGTDKPDSVHLNRFYHNLYALFPAGKFSISAGVDIGMEQKEKGEKQLNTWYSPVVIVRYPIAEKWTIAARGEYYQDKYGVIISTGTPDGFKTAGYSFNIDYAPVPNALIRIEARTFSSKDDVFIKNAGTTGNNSFITTSLAVSF